MGKASDDPLEGLAVHGRLQHPAVTLRQDLLKLGRRDVDCHLDGVEVVSEPEDTDTWGVLLVGCKGDAELTTYCDQFHFDNKWLEFESSCFSCLVL